MPEAATKEWIRKLWGLSSNGTGSCAKAESPAGIAFQNPFS